MPTKKQRTQKPAPTDPTLKTAGPPPEPAKAPPCPIAGIGASAGGLEALEQFLRHVPEKCGVAFVVVQHLDPTHKGIMPELLQRATTMEVFQARDRMPVRPDCVYVIPPNKDMSILHGALHLFEPAAPRGLRLPIDFFLRSLAEDCQERGIGVILSGMGSDGTMGLRAIKEKAGVTLVQEPASARFDSMPRSAIDAGLADLVAPASELPEKMMAYLRHAPRIAKAESSLDEKDRSALEKVIILLRAHTGNDFSLYKKATICRRIERRMGIHQIDGMNTYVRYLRENSQEVGLLFKELLIGVTSFFRDPEVWDHLRDVVLPEFLVQFPPGRVLRAWVPGCSTGEEAYSLAIVCKEALEKLNRKEGLPVQIFATDLDADAIEKARQGIFPANIAADVTPERLSRFFVQAENGYRVGKGIRDLVTFAPQNLIMDPPFTKLDLLSCRNLLIYLAPELQKKLLPLFHYSLNPGGLLVLGSSESIGAHTRLFAAQNGKSRIYRRRQAAEGEVAVEFPTAFAAVAGGAESTPIPRKAPESLQSQADRLLLQRYSPAAVLTSEQGDILYISGRTGKYLEPAAGKANWNVFAMAREGLRYELTSAFQKAVRQKEEATVRGIKIQGEGAAQTVDLTVQAVTEPEALRGMVMFVFRDVATPPEEKAAGRGRSPSIPGGEAAELREEVRRAQEEARVLREEMQTSQEEFRAVNEELQSANEELQSTNEELTTSREEMQSMNEELQTVNAEQLARLDELAWATSDMNNLLNSTEIATVFLDKGLRVRRFTIGSERIFKLIPADVGRSLTDISSILLYPELADDAREVLRTLTFSERQIASRDDGWFRVRIMPYRTQEDVIDGVVMTFTDITATKKLEAELREEIARLQGLLEAQAER
ncbi:chemotaxis protein CheB [Desulfuromonas sp. TF]|uniref:chemotaxis protein CheB n=1 Tax=Desulfuromonas sp. TF TaxID=1232410 RepID=UPI0003F532FD|nr:chemotaxis protein CheB [Desulfuromonas sp. TF]